MEEAEGKPQGTLPILEIDRPSTSKPGKYIFQSTAILEYLEDVYGADGPDMRGSTPEARARVRECLDVADEATTWLSLYTLNGSSLMSAVRKQEIGAAKEGLAFMHKALSVLEKLADAEGPFLVGGMPTIVDCALTATVQFADAVYHVDMLGKHPRLGKAVRAMEERGTAVMPGVPKMQELVGHDMESFMNVE